MTATLTAGSWDLRVHCQGAGPTIVLLHGLMTDHRAWDGVVAALRDRYRLITVDAPGHGGSPSRSGAYSLEDEADALVEALQELGVDLPVVWAGHSMGGMKALRIALRHPDAVSRLILVSTQPYVEPERTARPYTAMVEAASSWGISTDLAEVIGRLNFHPSFLAGPQGQRWVEHFTGLRGQDIDEACASVFRRGDISDRLGDITVPALVVHGEADIPIRIKVARSWVPLLPDAEFLEIPDCGHTPPCEQPDLLAASIDAFLQRLGTGQRSTAQAR
ncbi:3-oxoadipate enol-lactonase [Streptomyces sp. SPB162]|nr:3-oxoadipate enol-lactonase [Streptomyces sp. SPB162]